MWRVRAVAAVGWLVAIMVLCALPGLCSRAAARWCMVWPWAWGLLRVAGVRLQVTPARPSWPAGPAILVANHASLLDIPILCAVFGRAPRFVAKMELSRVPLLAFYMRRTGALLVDRRRGRQAASALDEVAARLGEGNPFCFFAEGARHADGAVHPFRVGAFRVAQGANVPVVPVAIVGSHLALPPGGIAPRRATVGVCVGDPIVPQPSETAPELAERVRAAIGAMHARLGGKGLVDEVPPGAAGAAGNPPDEVESRATNDMLRDI